MRPYLTSILLLLFALLLSLAIGSVFISPKELWQVILGNGNETFASILWKIRLPRTILIALTGAALGGSGATYQGLFRNPLADPFLIGVASGAGLGAVIAMSIKWPYSFWGLMAIPMSAFIAALLTVFIVYSLARVGNPIPTTNLILAGVAFSSFATSHTSFLMLRSTGEVLGMADSFGLAFFKAEEAAQQKLPTEGAVLITVTDEDKQAAGAKEADSGTGADIEVFPWEPDPGLGRRHSGFRGKPEPCKRQLSRIAAEPIAWVLSSFRPWSPPPDPGRPCGRGA